MAKSNKLKSRADMLAGIILLVVSLGLIVSIFVAMKQCTAQLPVPTQRPTTVTTVAPTQPPEPTLVPNPLESDGFRYDENGYLTCLTAESWLGVDVSVHQGKIDWQQVAKTDVQFAMVRLAYRGWGAEGVICADSRGLENLDGAADAGLKVGAYFFSQATSVEEAVEEARFLLDLLDGRKLDMPIVFDWENVAAADARTAHVTREMVTACALAFCREIEAAGYEAMVYYYLALETWKLDLLQIQQAGYGFWLAMYSDTLRYAHKVQMWQYANNGAVPGIATKVDMNLYFPGN